MSDTEFEEMAILCAEGDFAYEAGFLSKEAEDWVLVTQAFESGRLKGFAYCTLERIGGTPSVLVGLASVKRSSKRDSVLRAMVLDQFRRALMAFPDEDVLVGSKLVSASGFDAFRNLSEPIPRPGHKASGEERAWGRRLVKRFGIPATRYDDRAFVVSGDGSMTCVLDHEALKPEKFDVEVIAQFDGLKVDKGDVLIGFAWAMAEELEKLAS
ncbi:MAG: hypothetical protein V3V01_15875 [Acidimicrobiales bacterium]